METHILNLKIDVTKLPLVAGEEYGVHFLTGQTITIKYVYNTEKSPNLGAKFQQDIEPAGRYILHQPEPGDLPSKWLAGEITFQNPIVMALHTGSYVDDPIYNKNSWKAHLHRTTGKKGKALSLTLAANGYDAIITVDNNGNTCEIVDLTNLEGRCHAEDGVLQTMSNANHP